MKRHLVITSSTTTRPSADPDQAVADAAAGERKRLEAYLYSHSTLVAVVHDVKVLTACDGGHTFDKHVCSATRRVTQRALVTVERNTPEEARYSADYQSGRLQSGSFGVEDFVEDETSARHAVGLDEETEEPLTIAQALAEAADLLEREEVEYALGLDSDHVGDFTTITENGVERPYTDVDLQKDIDRHRRLAQLVREAAEILSNPLVNR